MTTKQLENALRDRYGFTKARAKEVVDSFKWFIQAGLAHDGIVRLDGVGTFKVQTKPARTMTVNMGPKKGQAIEVPERQVVKFKPSSKLLS